MLLHICQKYKCVIVGAGSCKRIYEQLDNFRIDIIGYYGMQESRIITESGKDKLVIIKNIVVDIDKDLIRRKIEKLREVTGYTEYIGDSVEFHDSGVVTFPLLGTKANIKDKLSFDPDRSKRRKIYEIVKKEFDGFTVFIGGSSSFDIVPDGFNKYNALIEYAKRLKINKNNIVYFGDDYGIGGNDEHIYKSDIKFIKVDDYSKFCECAKLIL